MEKRTGIGGWFAALTWAEKAAVAGSLAAAGFLVIDPLVLTAVQGLAPGPRSAFRGVTDLGKSSWILFPTGGAVLLLLALRTRDLTARARAAHGVVTQLFAFAFLGVGTAGLIASLTKNILGRARPKHAESLGSLHFEPFSFGYDFASFPSGHATTIAALAAVIAILWPRSRALVFVAAGWIAATRFLIGAHYFTDALAGVLLGAAVPYVLRDRLAARRWLFEIAPGGGLRLRGRRTRAWTGRQVRRRLWPRSRGAGEADESEDGALWRGL